MLKFRDIGVIRILCHEIECERHEFVNQHALMKLQPGLKSMVKGLFHRIGWPARLMMLETRPIRFETLEQLVDALLSAELDCKITDKRVEFVGHCRPCVAA